MVHFLLELGDQDVLNFFFQGKTLLIDPKWNTSQYLAGNASVTLDPCELLLSYVQQHAYKYRYDLANRRLAMGGTMTANEKKALLSFSKDPHSRKAIEELAKKSMLNTEHQGIVHLIGKVKPWHYDYHYKYKNLFFSILDRTEFRGWRPSKDLFSRIFLKIRRDCLPPGMILCKVRRLLKGIP